MTTAIDSASAAARRYSGSMARAGRPHERLGEDSSAGAVTLPGGGPSQAVAASTARAASTTASA